MRKALFALVLIATGVGVSGCWDHRGGYDHPGHSSDHHHGHGGGDHDHGG
jgi:hypothetical protein